MTAARNQPSFGRDIVNDVAGSRLALDLSGGRRRHGVLSHLRADRHESLDYRRGQAYESFGENLRGRNPHLIVVEIGGGQTGLDVIVCAPGEHASRPGEIHATGVFCYPVGEFTGGRERVQAGGDASTETEMSRNVFRARLRGRRCG